MRVWKICAGILLILAGMWGVLELLSRVLFHLWLNQEISILSERMEKAQK